MGTRRITSASWPRLAIPIEGNDAHRDQCRLPAAARNRQRPTPLPPAEGARRERQREQLCPAQPSVPAFVDGPIPAPLRALREYRGHEPGPPLGGELGEPLVGTGGHR